MTDWSSSLEFGPQSLLLFSAVGYYDRGHTIGVRARVRIMIRARARVRVSSDYVQDQDEGQHEGAKRCIYY